MLLCCEAGNTRIKISFFDGDKILKTSVIPTKSSDLSVCITEIIESDLSDYGDISGCALSCVVPSVTGVLSETLQKITGQKTFIANSGIKSPIKLNLTGKKEIGTDRLCNLTAGYVLYGSPLLIADFGTATHFDILNDNTEFTGGIIAPGLQMQAEALCSLTAALPKVEINNPDKIIGHDTVSEIVSGIVNGHAAMITEMINLCENEMGCELKTVATGGFSGLISSIVKRKFNFVNPELTSIGLKELYKLNISE